jgi:hypothetical protein
MIVAVDVVPNLLWTSRDAATTMIDINGGKQQPLPPQGNRNNSCCYQKVAIKNHEITTLVDLFV